MKMRLIKKNSKGFSLIELLVAATLLVVAAAAFLPAFTFVIRSNNQNQIRSTANSIATGVFEEISSMKYEDIGTVSGSPSGTVPQYRELTVDDILYKVETQISWGSTVDLGAEHKTNYVAYKNIRVIVKAVGQFTGTENAVDKMYSIVAKEGEQSLPDKGNMRVMVKDSGNTLISSLSLNIVATGPKTYSMLTDIGQIVFGEIDKGTYSVSAQIPDDYYVPQGETVTSGALVRSGVIIDDWNVKDITLYMDKLEKFSNLSVKLVDEDGVVIDKAGTITMKWDFEGATKNLFTNKAFSNGILDAGFIGRLWPLGSYKLSITFPASAGYYDYDMSTAINKPTIEGTGTPWNGTFSAQGETLSIVVPIEKKPLVVIRNAFETIEAESYDNKEANYTERNEDGGVVLHNFASDNYTVYKNVNFDTGAFMFSARVRGNNNRTVTIRADAVNGPIIGTLNFLSSENYEVQSCYINGITGVHDIYMVYSGNMRINWFVFDRLYKYDNFNDNKISSAWLIKNGNWSETDGTLRQTSTAQADPKKVILNNAGFNPSANYTITAKVMVNSWESNQDMARAGVSLFSNPTSGYGYNLLFHYNRVQFLDDMQGWSGNFTYSWSVGTWYWFKLRSNGRDLYGKIWADGATEPATWSFTWTAPSTRTGYPALNGGSGNTTVWFDRDNVWKPMLIPDS